jgi:DNA polymerase-3 subunit epsilon
MQDYLLFVDIESSGLPQDWEVPYSDEENWPHTVQVAWFVYTKDGQQVKSENHYIRPDGFEVKPSSIAVHHLTPEFLLAQGKSRREVLLLLQEELQRYRPMVIGHFMQFDYHVLSADFFREGLASPFENLPIFCTMIASSGLTHLPRKKHLRLGELYSHLFHRSLENQHNAVTDARATAESFFELRTRRVITEASMAQQQKKRYTTNKQAPSKHPVLVWLGAGLGVLLFIVLLIYWL